MYTLKLAFGITAATIIAASAIPVSAQEFPPSPPPDFRCNGVTCEGYIITGYDANGGPIYSYIVLPDIAGQAPPP